MYYAPNTGLPSGKINHDLPGFTLQVADLNRRTIAGLQLVQQGNRIVVIDKAHRLAGSERIQRAEDGCMAKALGDTTGVKRVDRFSGGVIADLGYRVFPFRSMKWG